ncbi:hypothetical protein [Paenibacillus cremeus]|uniref:Uncharacterized protein n=1 Tax=Paenibacillus cremeus TaxID=2163881 RepID=A0A559KF17_9BACL|nr:hypothetical protein [Paenibacillus cremeus]TVY10722.1 hypothetical protein FPZ49_06325 [Paenibacillus cremeus]
MKWLTWMMRLVLTAVITSVCCVVMTFAAVNTYVDLLLDQYHIQRPAGQKIDWNQFVGRFTSQFSSVTSGMWSGKAPQKDVAVSATTTTPSSETGTKEQKDGSEPTAPGSKGTDGEKRPPEDAVAVWSRQSTSQGSSSQAEDRRVIISSEDFAKKKEQLSDANKAKVFSVLMSRVPQAEIQKISLILEDGITVAELKELDQILKQYLKPEEYTELQGLIQAP